MESNLIYDIFSWIGGISGVSVLAIFGWYLRRKFTQVEDHEVRLSLNEDEIKRMREAMITLEQVRSIIHQSNEPLLQSLLSVESNLNSNTQTMNIMLQELSERRGYEKAMKELRGTNDN